MAVLANLVPKRFGMIFARANRVPKPPKNFHFCVKIFLQKKTDIPLECSSVPRIMPI